MFGACVRGLLLIAAVSIAMMSSEASGATLAPSAIHREAVDEQSYPWSAVGKLFTEGVNECSGVLISRNKILTAAHCLFNYRTRRYIQASSLHFLVGYRTGRYSAHARIARYEIGAGFDPLRYEQTLESDWAILTVTETLPMAIEPLRLSREPAPSGTRAFLVGYPQDRALAMTADRDCELREKIAAGRLMLHTCRGIKGYSGGPILVSSGGREMHIAGIQIAIGESLNGETKMVAVPAQAIWAQSGDTPDIVAAAKVLVEVCRIDADRETGLQAIRARFDLGPIEDEPEVVSSIPAPSAQPTPGTMAWLDYELFATAIP